MSVPRVLVINPNSDEGVTRGIDRALAGLREATGATVDVTGLTGTPRGIESQRDVDLVATPVAERVAAAAEDYDAFVVACFSDPGLHGARQATARPVFGIAASGLLTALGLADAVGVISILPASLPRHWRYYRSLGVASRVAGDVAVGAGVSELADEDAMGGRMEAAGRRLVEERGADVLVLGCAGMAHYRQRLERSLGVSVVDPTQAATAMAVAAAALGYRTS
ncbi:MAG TPA: aspartate/glutamate racemase family protein [Trueperaceae bacterium]|nr:aspartate/glutamate racemase family protein [Trueperaceae bacterium]